MARTTREEFLEALISLESNKEWAEEFIGTIFADCQRPKSLDESLTVHGEYYWICLLGGYNPVIISHVGCDTVEFFHFLGNSDWMESKMSFGEFLDSVFITLTGAIVLNGVSYDTWEVVKTMEQSKKCAQPTTVKPAAATKVATQQEKQPWVL